MSTTHRLLCIPFWLAVFMGALGYVMTFVPGSECGWFIVVAALSLFGFFIPKTFYRGAAMLLLVLSIIAAVRGFGRGVEYYEGAAIHQTTK